MKSRSPLESPSGGVSEGFAFGGYAHDRRHAHLLAGLEPRIGLHAPGVDAHLAGAQQLLQMAVA